MLINVASAAWIIGSITLLIVKGDEKTGEYRDSLQILQQYCEMNHFDEALANKLRLQLRLEFNNREVSDEKVLQHFPSAVRRKILRRLYLQPLVQTQLMHEIRPQFIDAFLASCTVEIFSPGEEIVERGAILSDLFLLVGGLAQITTEKSHDLFRIRSSCHDADQLDKGLLLKSGDFIGDIGFFTESPQIDSVTCLTLCKTLTISQTAYKQLAQDHPSSAGKILQNLLKKVESQLVSLPKRLEVLRAGSSFDMDKASYLSMLDIEKGQEKQRLDSQTAVADLVKMHMDKQLDDQTTRFLYAASRGDTATISLMCDQGFDPNNADYDRRTAIMVASMKGNTDVVRLLLEFKVSTRSFPIKCQLRLFHL
jgi:CRP-like cAMP-binding protein